MAITTKNICWARQSVKAAKALLAGGASLLALSFTAHAQQAGGRDQTEALEEHAIENIIVTASKREQSLSELASSVDVISADTLRNLPVMGMEDLTKLTPSVSYQGAGKGGTSKRGGSAQIFLRGVSDGGDGNLGGTGPSAAMYIDETPVTNIQSNPDLNLYDIERVEILNGPQGTLYGKSSQSGAIRIITKEANAKDFAATLDLDYGNIKGGTENRKIEGMVNIPLVKDRIALRIVGHSADYGGYIDNTRGTQTYGIIDQDTGKPVISDNIDIVGDDYNVASASGFRTKLRFDVTDDFIIRFSTLYEDQSRSGSWFVDRAKGGLETTLYDLDNGSNEYRLYSLVVEKSIGFANLIYAGALYKRDYRNEFDWSRPPSNEIAIATCDYDLDFNAPFVVNGKPTYDFFNLATTNYRNCGDPSYQFDTTGDFDSQTHEVRAVSTHGGPLRWTVGGYYEKADLFFDLYGNTEDVKDAHLFPWNRPGAIWESTSNRNMKTWAVFGEADFTFNAGALGDITLTAGARHFKNETVINTITDPTPVWFTLQTAPFTEIFQSEDAHTLTKFQITWEPMEDLLFWAVRSQGYRPGGPNRTTNPVIPPQYDADFLVNKEFGWRTAFADGAVSFSGALFEMTWNDFQTATWNPFLSAFGFTDNVGQARIRGIEGALALYPSSSFDASINFAVYDAETTKAVPTVAGNIPEGTQLPYTPDYKITAYGNYYFKPPVEALKNWGGYAHGAISIAGRSATELNPFFAQKTEPYSTTTLALGIMNDHWNVYAYVWNLTNARAASYIDAITNFELISRPRTIGLHIGYSY